MPILWYVIPQIHFSCRSQQLTLYIRILVMMFIWCKLPALDFVNLPHHTIWIDCRCFTRNTRSTQRAQTSLAEEDHYSHIAHCKKVEPWWWKSNPKGFGSVPEPQYSYHVCVCLLFFFVCFFFFFFLGGGGCCAHLLILEDLDHYQNLISSSFY